MLPSGRDVRGVRGMRVCVCAVSCVVVGVVVVVGGGGGGGGASC